MSQHQDTRRVRIRKSITTGLLRPTPAPAQPRREPIPGLEAGTGEPRRRHRDGWIVAILVLALGVFTGSLAKHVVLPAMDTVASSSVKTWTGDGP